MIPGVSKQKKTKIPKLFPFGQMYMKQTTVGGKKLAPEMVVGVSSNKVC